MDFEVRWTTPAADDLAAIFAHLAEIDPHAAERQGKTILDHIELLRTFPGSGRVSGESRAVTSGRSSAAITVYSIDCTNNPRMSRS
jgi:plasmid stabilization system protein ParE